MKFPLARLGLLAAVYLWAAVASAAGLAPISQVFVFGDSLSDTGNAFAATGGALPPSPPYFAGRVSNGPVWVEPLSSDLGVSFTNYAVAGAQTGTGNVNSGLFPILDNTGLQNQVTQFQSDLGGGAADPGALYVVFAGANNFCTTCFVPGVDDPVEFINTGVTEILTAIGGLQATGAQKFPVWGLPDLGLTPRAAGIPFPGIQEQLSMLTDGWNQALFGNLPNLGLGDNLLTLDTAQLLRDVVADPAGFDLTNVTDACLLVPLDCDPQTDDPDGFLFWDEIHPTEAGHAILADAALQTVIPVPPALLLFGSALGLLGWVRRRTAA